MIDQTGSGLPTILQWIKKVLPAVTLFGPRKNSVTSAGSEYEIYHMSLVVRKPVFGVSDLVRHKPGCAITEDDLRLEIVCLGRRGIVLAM